MSDSTIKIPKNTERDYDFIAFSFKGLHSFEDFGIYRVSDSNQGYNDTLTPTAQDKVVDNATGDGQYYFESYHKNKVFNIKFAFDNLTERQLQKLKKWLCGLDDGDLWFPEMPHKVYTAKVTGTPQITAIPFFTSQDGRFYKGTGSVTFTAYEPYAHTPDLIELADGTKVSGNVYTSYSTFNNYNEISNLLPQATDEKGQLERMAYGDLPFYFKASLTPPAFVSDTLIGFTGLTRSDGVLTWTGDIAEYEGYTTTTEGENTLLTSPLDNIFPYNQIEEFTDEYGNVFIKFPKLYMRYIKDANGYVDGAEFSNVQKYDDMFIPDCFLNPADGTTYLDYFALGRYKISVSSGCAKSVSGTKIVVSALNTFRGQARAYGTFDNYYNGYQLMDYSMATVYTLLSVLYLKTSNSQRVFSGTEVWTYELTGSTENIATLNGKNNQNAYRLLGIENPTGNYGVLLDGLYNQNNQPVITRLPQYFGTEGTQHQYPVEEITFPSANESYISFFKTGNTVETRTYIFPVLITGSATTYVGDTFTNLGTRACLGGASNSASCGVWRLHFRHTEYGIFNDVSARLAYRPINK